MAEDEIQQQLQKIQEKNCKQDESMNEVFEKFERLKEEILEIKEAIADFRRNMNNGWKNDLVAMVIKATLGIRQTKTVGFWDWVKVAFSAAFFVGIIELLKIILTR